MSDTKMKAAFDQQAKLLCGQLITGVRYVDIQDANDSSPWSSAFRDFDALAFGLDLEIPSIGVFGCTWGSEFVQYGLSFQNRPIEEDVGIRSVWNVSSGTRWESFLHQTIRGTRIYWQELITSGVPRIYPQDLEIVFESGSKVYLCARIYLDSPPQLFPFSDEIAVVFDDVAAKKYHVGPYAHTT